MVALLYLEARAKLELIRNKPIPALIEGNVKKSLCYQMNSHSMTLLLLNPNLFTGFIQLLGELSYEFILNNPTWGIFFLA